MTRSDAHRRTPPSAGRWFHRLALLLACVTFPLICVGGLVTTYQAGMAVPDWPGTYGYNLFLYPWQTWLAGPWDLFIEHGHRLLGATAGMVAIALVAVAWMGRGPRWHKWMSLVALALVIGQGVLGGFRVLMNERLLAMIHGCVGPVFFALAVSLVVCSSRRWQAATTTDASRVPLVLAVATALVAYAQLVLGAMVRHVPVMAGPNWFRLAMTFHLIVALVLTLHVLALAWRSWQGRKAFPALRRTAYALVGLIGCQVALGSATWIVKYGWPSWLQQYDMGVAYTVQTESMLQAIIVTGHVATGSLILATAVTTALYASRLARRAESAAAVASLPPEGALA